MGIKSARNSILLLSKLGLVSFTPWSTLANMDDICPVTSQSGAVGGIAEDDEKKQMSISQSPLQITLEESTAKGELTDDAEEV